MNLPGYTVDSHERFVDQMDLERDKQGYLSNRLRYYAEQKNYLVRLQPLYQEMKMIFRDLHAAYDEYWAGRAEFRPDGFSKLDPNLLERIAFLQNQLNDVRWEIATILNELKKLEEKNQM